jgi:Xaa-Pro aminopeptidase
MSDDADASTGRAAPLRFSDAEFARRYAAVREMMAERGLDALLVYASLAGYAEVQYLSDFRTSREAYLVVPAAGEPTLLVQYFNHVPYARRRARVADVRWAGPPDLSTIVAHLRDRGLGNGRIGIVGALPWQQGTALRSGLPKADSSDATGHFQRLRLIKS